MRHTAVVEQGGIGSKVHLIIHQQLFYFFNFYGSAFSTLIVNGIFTAPCFYGIPTIFYPFSPGITASFFAGFTNKL